MAGPLMARGSLPKTKEYTYADIEQWPADERWELINGTPYNMSPPPARMHQKISGVLFRKIGNYLEGKTCEVYSAPFGVWLVEKEEDIPQASNYVEPDIVVVCDQNKLTDKGCAGAPDLIIEIVSPSTAAKDMCQKLNLYEASGVKEYWVVHPADRVVMVFHLDGNKYGRPMTYSPEEPGANTVRVGILPDLEINLGEVFAE